MPIFSLNDTVYYANIVSNAFSRQKIEKTDEAGLIWYRYDKERYDYSIVPLQIVAIESHSLEAIPGVEIDADLETSYHFSDNTQAYESEIDEPSFRCRLFCNLQDAESLIQNHREHHDL